MRWISISRLKSDWSITYGRLRQRALPLMQQGGRIVFVTSHLAHFYDRKPGYEMYELVAASKYAGEQALRKRIPELLEQGGSAVSPVWQYKDQLLRIFEKKNDATLKEYCELLADETGLWVSQATMCRTFQKLNLPLKKKRSVVAKPRANESKS